MENSTNQVTVKQITIEEFLDSIYYIPDYQRSFAWGKIEVDRLIDTLLDPECHFLGNFIIHKEGKILNVVDGQQRLTCLFLAANKLAQLHIPQSNFNKEVKGKLKIAKELLNRIYESKTDWLKMWVQVTTVTDLDLAFTFFDAQNTSGLASASKDILKSRHLQKMQEHNQGDEKQVKVDEMWSEMEDIKEDDFTLTRFLNECLFPLRKWVRGEKLGYFYETENQDREFKNQILNEFAGKEIMDIIPSTTDYSLPLKSYGWNVKESELKLSISIKEEWLGSVSMYFEPGEMFFKYIKHYYYLWKAYKHNWLLTKEIDNYHESIRRMNRIAIASGILLMDYYGIQSPVIEKFKPFVFSNLINCRVSNSQLVRSKIAELEFTQLSVFKSLFQHLYLNKPLTFYLPASKPDIINIKPIQARYINFLDKYEK